MEERTPLEKLLSGQNLSEAQLYGLLTEDLYPPLNNAMNAISLLKLVMEKQPEPLSSKALQLLDAAYDSLVVLNQYVGNMRDLSLCRQEGLALTEMDLAAQLRSLAGVITPYARREGVSLEVKAPEELWVRGDPALSERVLVWLIGSLVTAGMGRGSLRLSLSLEGEEAALSLRDLRPCQGPGRAILGEGPLAEGFAGQKAGLVLAGEFCRAMGWRLEAAQGQENAGFALWAPCAPAAGARLCSADESAFKNKRRSLRLRREMERIFGRL